MRPVVRTIKTKASIHTTMVNPIPISVRLADRGGSGTGCGGPVGFTRAVGAAVGIIVGKAVGAAVGMNDSVSTIDFEPRGGEKIRSAAEK